MGKINHLMSNEEKDVFIPLVPSVLGAMLMSKVSRQKEGFRSDLLKLVEEDMVNLPEQPSIEMFKKSYVVANGFMEKWGVNYGHSSIKELDTLQMCLENRSRWFTEILETLQASKFMSYIEYSLRYNPPKSYYIPKEFDADPAIREKYVDFCDACFDVYREINEDFVNLFKARYPEMSDKDVKIKAFENARNVLPLSTHANMGMQSNLRAFCDGLSELMAYEGINSEILETATIMKEEAEKVSVGMVRHVEKTKYGESFVRSFYDDERYHRFLPNGPERYEHKTIKVKVSDQLIGDVSKVSGIGDLSSMSRFDELPNVFKTIGRWVEVDLTEAAHHQFLRHRAFDYRPLAPSVDYGYITPEELKKDDNVEIQDVIIRKIADIYSRSCEIFDLFKNKGYKYLSPYVVLNCNIRRTEFFANFYALSHFVTLRKEPHSQDEIRSIAERLDIAFKSDKELFSNLKFDKNE